MARRNRGRRNGGQNQPQPRHNQASASSPDPIIQNVPTPRAQGNDTTAATQMPHSLGRHPLAALASNTQQYEHQRSDYLDFPTQDPILAEGATTEINGDVDDGFQPVMAVDQSDWHFGYLDYLLARERPSLARPRDNSSTQAVQVPQGPQPSTRIVHHPSASLLRPAPIVIRSTQSREHERPSTEVPLLARPRDNSSTQAVQVPQGPQPSTRIVHRTWASLLMPAPIVIRSTQSREHERPSTEVPLQHEEPLPLPTPNDPVPSPNQEAPPEPLDMRKLAEDASVLLELYSKSDPNDNHDESRQLIEGAFESISKVRRHYRIKSTQQGGRREVPIEENDEVKIDAGCIICYTEIADTLLIPCNHLVLCTSCCDMMGIQGKDNAWGKNVPCPICRRNAVDRIKVFRC